MAGGLVLEAVVKTAWMLAVLATAQTEVRPGDVGDPTAKYACVHPDGSRTFRNDKCPPGSVLHDNTPPPPAPKPPPEPTADVHLQDFRCASTETGQYTIATGRVSNRTARNLDSVRVSVSFSRGGTHIDSGLDYLDLDPLFPFQAASFKVYGPAGADRCIVEGVTSSGTQLVVKR